MKLVVLTLDPADFAEPGQTLAPLLEKPVFADCVVGDAGHDDTRRLPEWRDGFVIETAVAGGHNAPPRGQMQFTPTASRCMARDVADLDIFRKIGLPFWLAGGYGSPEKYREALGLGAAGIQMGTAFALCTESGLAPDLRRALVTKALTGKARVFTDALASPTGFPFKVAELEGTLSDPDVYARRQRVCNLGFLREAYRKADGSLGYRCAAEPEAAWIAKGGKPEAAAGRKCLCNALVANIGLPCLQPDGSPELPLVTLGDDLAGVGRFCADGQTDYTAADVIQTMAG